MNKRKINRAGIFALITGAVLMITGVINGEHTQVFEKAIRICLECIGIG